MTWAATSPTVQPLQRLGVRPLGRGQRLDQALEPLQLLQQSGGHLGAGQGHTIASSKMR